MANINFDKHIYEGWTVGNFIEELQPDLDMIQTGNSWLKPMTTKTELRKWIGENQPYYKKPVPEVVNYFCSRYAIK
nr:MAG TPA: hypothetical protein [Caudoviricetes sp.]